MHKIQTFNNISPKGISILEDQGMHVSDSHDSYDGIVLRSQKLHDMSFPDSLRAIGRAGAGVNNIPVADCTEQGIVVFNTPGANANAVKELVICGMLLAARDIIGGVEFSKTLKGQGDSVGPNVEKNKSRFAGTELKGKTLAVIGLGAIGLIVANTALELGMTVQGYDPFLSVNRAWELSSAVQPATSLEKMLESADYVSIHVPYSVNTKDFLTHKELQHLKAGAVLLNFSRDALINEEAVIEALNTGKVAKYVTDFPTDALLNTDNVIPIPHLGASTVEAEENCAIMIANQLSDFLKNGNIVNSVNFPNCTLERTSDHRLTIMNKNVPNMLSQVTTILAKNKLNITEMVNKSRDELAYNIVDFNGQAPDDLIQQIKSIEGVIRARILL